MGRPRTFVIAEAGLSHDGNRSKINALWYEAQEAGADACKFQWWSRTHPPREHLTKYAVPLDWLLAAKKQDSMLWLCTVYLTEDLTTIAPHVEWIKVGSYEARDDAFLEEALKLEKPVLASSGFRKEICPIPGLFWLKCVSKYPAPLEDMKLHGDDFTKDNFTGLSDHTANPLTGAIAVACGAKIVEVHFRLHETNKDSPDYEISLHPGQLRQYIRNIRTAERLCA